MAAVVAFFDNLKESHADLFQKITTNEKPDSQKLRVYLNENNIECRGSNMMSLLQALSQSLTMDRNNQSDTKLESDVIHSSNTENDYRVDTKDTRNDNSKVECETEQSNSNEKTKYSIKDFHPDAVQALSFEFEVLHGVYKVGKSDESRQKSLEDAHIKCDNALEWMIEIKNSSDDFASVIGGVTYAADTPSLANALFELYLSLN